MTAVAHGRSVPWLLALHSSSEVFGVACQPLGKPEVRAEAEAFPIGRGLANSLLTCVETVLPASEWSHLGRVAVATGPGGFTGTRLSVAFARTLCQQLGVPLDGISSFHLIARRWLGQHSTDAPLILTQQLPRHGVVAGLYGVDPKSPGGVAELSPPRLYRQDADVVWALGPHARVPAEPQLPADAEHLLAFGQEAAHLGLGAPWSLVVPIYPTSPVDAP